MVSYYLHFKITIRPFEILLNFNLASTHIVHEYVSRLCLSLNYSRDHLMLYSCMYLNMFRSLRRAVMFRER